MALLIVLGSLGDGARGQKDAACDGFRHTRAGALLRFA